MVESSSTGQIPESEITRLKDANFPGVDVILELVQSGWRYRERDNSSWGGGMGFSVFEPKILGRISRIIKFEELEPLGLYANVCWFDSEHSAGTLDAGSQEVYGVNALSVEGEKVVISGSRNLIGGVEKRVVELLPDGDISLKIGLVASE